MKFQFLQEKEGGLLCLLYSLVLSKGFDEYCRPEMISDLTKSAFRIKADMQDQFQKPLVTQEDEVRLQNFARIHIFLKR